MKSNYNENIQLTQDFQLFFSVFLNSWYTYISFTIFLKLSISKDGFVNK